MSIATSTELRPGTNEQAATGATPGARLVRFQVGGQLFALPLERVAEVVALGSSSATAPRGWLGTLVRNARPVPIGDLAFLLGLPAQATTRREMRAVILRGTDPALPLYGVTVESVPSVLAAGEDSPQLLPPIVRRGGSPLIQASLIHGEEMFLILDAEAISERLASGTILTADGRVTELRSLPRRPGHESARFSPPGATGQVPGALRRDTPALLLGSIETADGDAGIVPAMPMAWVQEVRALPALRRIPHASAGLVGMFAWRDHCLPVIDLAQRLTGIPSAEHGRRRLVIVGPQHGRALGGLIVPGVRGLATLAASPTTAAPPPDTLATDILSAWTRHGDDAVALLDPTACFA